LPEAHAAYLTAVEIQEKRWGPDDVTLGEILVDLGQLLLREGDHEPAYRAFQRAHAIFEKRMGPDFEVTASALASMGVALVALGRTAEGLAAVEKARATLVKLGGADHHSVGVADQQLGELRRDLGEHDLAMRAFDHAVAIFQQDPPDARRLSASRFALARELWDSGADRPRATALARSASVDLQPLGPAADRDRQRIALWLAGHRR
jgi:tetratricopeptide (TPR) repeat protein